MRRWAFRTTRCAARRSAMNSSRVYVSRSSPSPRRPPRRCATSHAVRMGSPLTASSSGLAPHECVERPRSTLRRGLRPSLRRSASNWLNDSTPCSAHFPSICRPWSSARNTVAVSRQSVCVLASKARSISSRSWWEPASWLRSRTRGSSSLGTVHVERRRSLVQARCDGLALRALRCLRHQSSLSNTVPVSKHPVAVTDQCSNDLRQVAGHGRPAEQAGAAEPLHRFEVGVLGGSDRGVPEHVADDVVGHLVLRSSYGLWGARPSRSSMRRCSAASR